MTNQEAALKAIKNVTEEIYELLESKNKAYGNSAFNPVRIFSKADTIEQINVRMDDKLSRMARGLSAGEDPELDLLGYLILKRAYPEYVCLTNPENSQS